MLGLNRSFIKKKATMFCICCEDYIPRGEHLIEARSADTNVIGCAETTCMQDFDKDWLTPQPQATNLHQICNKILQLLTESLQGARYPMITTLVMY